MENGNKFGLVILGAVFLAGLTFLPLYFLPLPIFILTIVAGYHLSRREKEGLDAYRLFLVFLTAYFARVIMALILYKFSLGRGLIGFFSGGDDLAYGKVAVRLADIWRSGIFPPFKDVRMQMSPSGTMGFYQYYLAVLMLISRNSTFLPIVINCSIGGLSIFALRSICRRLFDQNNPLSKKATFVCIIIFAVWPSLILWSALNLKEAFTIFFFLLLILAIIRIVSEKISLPRLTGHLLLAGGSLLLLFQLRENIYSIVIGTLVLTGLVFLAAILPDRLKKFAITLFVIASAALIFIAVFSEIQFIESFVKVLNVHRDYRTIGGTAILPDLQYRNLGHIISFLPMALVIAFFYPLPWQITSFKSFTAIPETLLWYFLFFFFCRGVVLSLQTRGKGVYFPLFFTIIYFLLMGFGEGNAGTLFRHRAIILPVIFIFISAGCLSGNIFKLRDMKNE